MNAKKLWKYQMFSVQDSVVHVPEVLRGFGENVEWLKPKESVFVRFRKVQQHPKYMDDAILRRKIITVKHKPTRGNLNFSCRIV